MLLDFEAYGDFYRSLEAVNTLLSFAKSEDSKDNQDNRNLFMKLSIVLMVTRFQVFVEAILEEFAFKLKISDITFDSLPVQLKLNSIRMKSEGFIIHNKLENVLTYNEEKIEKIKNHISEISCHFSKNKINENLMMKNKFPLGKTGKFELISLFSQLEGGNIFEMADFDIDKIDGLLQIRHGIVHQDIFPNMTEGNILGYKDYLNNTSKLIDNYLRLFIQKLSEQVA